MDQIMLRIMLDAKRVTFYYARKHNYANSGNIAYKLVVYKQGVLRDGVPTGNNEFKQLSVL